MPDDSVRPDLRRAYREAWDTRKSTGDTSDAVLLRRLHLHGLFLDPESSGALDVVLGLWRRGVTPRRLTWELAKEVGRTALVVGRAFAGIARAFAGTGFEKQVSFEPLVGGRELSRLLLETGPADADGDAAYDVWFDVRSTPEPQAQVLLGRVLIGRTTIPASEWAELQALAAEDVFAEGTLDARESDGLLVVEGLSYGGVTDDEDD